jgi:multicomponent Na+:H+ antiporter subunit A
MGGLPPFFGFHRQGGDLLRHWRRPRRGRCILTLVAVAGNGADAGAIAFAVALKPFVGPLVETPTPSA